MTENHITRKGYQGKIVLYILLQFLQTALALLPPYCYLLFLNQVIAEIGRASCRERV